MAYQGTQVRRGGATPEPEPCRRNPKGRANPWRRAALLVVAILLRISMSSSSLLVLLAFEPSAAMGACCSVLKLSALRVLTPPLDPALPR